MPETKTTVTYKNRAREAVKVQIDESTERWSEISLKDGSSLRLKPVITNVMRLVDEFDADGSPVYMIRSTNVLTVDAADHLRKGSIDPPERVQ